MASARSGARCPPTEETGEGAGRMNTESDVKQGLGWVVKLAGWNIKSIATSDDLKEHVLTIKISRPSAGWHQEHLDFDGQTDLVAQVNGRGEVEHVDTGDPDDYNEVATVGNTSAGV